MDGEVSTRRVTCFAFRYFTVNNNINVVGVLSLAELLDNWQKNLLLRKSPLRLRLIGNVELKFVLHKIKLAFEIKRKSNENTDVNWWRDENKLTQVKSIKFKILRFPFYQLHESLLKWQWDTLMSEWKWVNLITLHKQTRRRKTPLKFNSRESEVNKTIANVVGDVYWWIKKGKEIKKKMWKILHNRKEKKRERKWIN